MPTYEYKREDGTVFEVFQSMSEDPLTECPTTGQPVKRLISGGSGLVFKGSGFYVTDYKNGNGAKSASSKSNGAANTSETSASSSDTSETSAKSDSGSASDTKKNGE
ncbi:MAG: FmdB family zinc ribbon protein [Balneolaceae bacterium]